MNGEQPASVPSHRVEPDGPAFTPGRRGAMPRLHAVRSAVAMTLPVDPRLAAAYLLVSLTLTLTPGPDTLFVIANGMRHRARGAVASALGIGGGSVIHGLTAALGLSALVETSAFAFVVVKTIGAGYLGWLGLKALHAAFRPRPEAAGAGPEAPASLATIFRRGLVNNLTNPKVPLFYVAILPQFVDSGRGHIGLQLFLLSLLGTIVAVPYLVGVGVLSGRMRERLTGAAFGRWLDGIAGAVFVGLAVRLAVTGRPER